MDLTNNTVLHVHYEYNYGRRIGETPNPGLRIQVNITKKLRIGRVKNMGYRLRTIKNRKNWILKQSSPEYVILEDFNFTLGRLYPS